MSKYKRKLPTPRDERATWVYYVSRDSTQGELSGSCSLWYAKPMRTKISYRTTWIAGDDRNPGYLGEYTVDDVARWFGVVPETDLELLKIEQFVTEKMLAEAKPLAVKQ